MGKQDLIVPRGAGLPDSQRTTVTVSVPALPTSGFVENAITRFRNNNSARASDARARYLTSQASEVKASTQLVEAQIAHEGALVRLQENPERLGHEVAMRRIDRAHSYREKQHQFEITVLKQRNELTDMETEYTHKKASLTNARTVLLDAEQQLEAQRQYGFFNYKLAHRKKAAEQLDIELSEAERRAILRQHIRELKNQEWAPGNLEEVSEETLHAKRNELNASGLDTSRIDAELDRRRVDDGDAE